MLATGPRMHDRVGIAMKCPGWVLLRLVSGNDNGSSSFGLRLCRPPCRQGTIARKIPWL